ncbi:MAG TPA: YidB family protein [Albitalea sp.]|nr:YidB family protein [Albitalea sp.]
MGLLDSVIGALSGIRTGGGRGDMLPAVLSLLAGPGIDRIVERFEQGGLSDVMDSWIARGENLPISADALQRVLGADTVEQIAQQAGLSNRATADRLSRMLPYVVDKLTPAGRVPESGLGDVGELTGRMARR